MNTNTFRLIIRVLGILLAASLVILVVVRLSASESVAPSPTAAIPTVISPTDSPEIDPAHAFESVQLAWFYKPPDESLLSVLAENFDIFILTHKDEGQRDTLRSLGVKSPIFVYLLLMEIKDPGSCTKGPQGNQVAYEAGDFCEISEKHPDWFLLDQNGNRIVDGKTFYMDPGNAEYRAFWLQRARALQEQYHWDGIFIDNVDASLGKLENMGFIPAKYPDEASYQSAIKGFLEYLHENHFGPGGQPVLANIISVDDWDIWLQYLQYLNGAMIEAFAVDWSDGYRSSSEWESQMDAINQALSQEKNLVLVSQTEQEDPDRQRFAFASYLLIANKNVFFRYADSSAYREVLLYGNYSLDLGQSLGPRYKDGSSWRRDFTNGYILVDPEKNSADIKLNP